MKLARAARRCAALALALAAAACHAAGGTERGGDALLAGAPALLINELMIDPAAVADERGEWVELLNAGRDTVQLRGWTIRSGNDRPWRISTPLVLPPGGLAVLGRDAAPARNGGAPVAIAYGNAFALGNGTDWIAIDDPSGATVDSVAWHGAPRGAAVGRTDVSRAFPDASGRGWTVQETTFGAGDRGTPGMWNDGAVSPGRLLARGVVPTLVTGPPVDSAIFGGPGFRAGEPRLGEPAFTSRELVLTVLDVGQGDAILIRNGTSTLLVDGGPEPARLGHLLDSLGLNGTTIDVVVLTHAHHDHHSGLRELFRSRRNIHVRYFFENRDPSPSAALAELRDSVAARARRGELVVRDADDPCGDGRPVCTVTLNGGARLHVMRPLPASQAGNQNDRSIPLKLVGPQPAASSVWLAGDAEQQALRWAQREYAAHPGLRSDVLKLSHHGSCDGISRAFLRAVGARVAVASLAGVNDYGHVHAQTTTLLREAGSAWYRTDVNGAVTVRSTGAAEPRFVVEAQRGERSPAGVSDRRSNDLACRGS